MPLVLLVSKRNMQDSRFVAALHASGECNLRLIYAPGEERFQQQLGEVDPAVVILDHSLAPARPGQKENHLRTYAEQCADLPNCYVLELAATSNNQPLLGQLASVILYEDQADAAVQELQHYLGGVARAA